MYIYQHVRKYVVLSFFPNPKKKERKESTYRDIL